MERTDPSEISFIDPATPLAAEDDPAPATTDFARFYERELGPMVRLAGLIIGSRPQAEEVVHEAFVEVWRRWADLDDPGPYLNRSVVNGARASGRRRRRQQDLVERLARRRPVPADEVEVLTDLLAGLPFPQRAAIVLRYYGGFTEREIAAVLDCPVGSVGPWINRGLRRLRRALT